MAQKK